ncbi:GroES-like protein [Lophium mytilinum]|uniref:GroES-like protein n=1 Tax=Lophium mytilinum TaxID=390894 RepID=A0A6A6RAM7_9PEZI|nr:GroES-like protein [Lophium mytilinum]
MSRERHDSKVRGSDEDLANGLSKTSISVPEPELPSSQTILLLKEVKTPYTLTPDYPIPVPANDNEILIRTQVIGLNPIDWKAPDYNFGIPSLPHICGRDAVGIVVRAPKSTTTSNNPSRIKVGDTVIATSTDYRNTSKSTFQSYILASLSNTALLPASISPTTGAALGVAYVAAVLALGICLGIDFSALPLASAAANSAGPHLLEIVSKIPDEKLPADVIAECRRAQQEDGERQFAYDARKPGEAGMGDWIAVWGSSTTGFLISQLARLAGLRVALVVDLHKHGARLYSDGADLLVDAHDPGRAVAVIRGVTQGRLRFGVDTVGKETAEHLADALANDEGEEGVERHLVGLTGLPKEKRPGVVHHTVPIKLFHEVLEVGEGLMKWLEVLLAEQLLKPPEIEVVEGGLESVNGALDRMRRGEISGKRMVVKFPEES